MIELKNKQYPARYVHKEEATCHISGTGLARASKCVSNDDLAKIVETSDEWISSRSGIKTRYLVEEETTSDLAAQAAEKALNKSGLKQEDIGLIIVASFTGESKLPSLACRVQARLGIPNAIAFDLAAACSGFVFAMNTAVGLLEGGHAEHALIIGAEVLSKTLDWTDRTTCVLFGDGAGAV